MFLCKLPVASYVIPTNYIYIMHWRLSFFAVNWNSCTTSSLYVCPGVVYQPGEPLLLQSVGNTFVLRCVDGLYVDGSDRYISAAIYRWATASDSVLHLLLLLLPLNNHCQPGSSSLRSFFSTYSGREPLTLENFFKILPLSVWSFVVGSMRLSFHFMWDFNVCYATWEVLEIIINALQ